MTDTPNFRYIGKPRQPSEDRRFVAGHGRFAADVAIPQTKHVALVSSPWAAARIVDIDIGAAAKSRGVCGLLTGREIAQSTTALATGVDTPAIQRWPLAVDVVRYAGEWVVAIIADSRAEAEDAAELVEIDYEELPFVLDPEQAFDPAS
ncbi:MAG: xanthine dehydrogenase family protein molybdopterin-binding subunit, partial [Hyphomicrobiaceae bacterium]